MSIIKRHKIKSGKRRVFYQAQVYARGMRLCYKSFNTKAEAVIWHETQKRKLTKDPSALFETDKSEMSFSDCFKKYLKEAFPLLKRSTRETYEARFRYFIKGPLPHVRMGELKAHAVYNWIEWLKKQETIKNKNRHTFKHELKFLSVILKRK